MANKTWFITGTSRGFGREWTQAALERGDRVAATARDPKTLDDVFEAVRTAHDHFGRLDIVVNNAGYGHFGMVEEISEEEARAQIETNLFGALWGTQAALPFLREQGSGHIIQVSSIGGISAFAGVGIYHASKWALEGISQALSLEVKDFGINVTLVEPGGFSTDWAGPSSKRSEPNPAYDKVREAGEKRRGGMSPGDPVASAEAIMRVVDADQPPLRVFFGSAPLGIAEKDYESRLATWREWQPVAELAHGGE
jgi:NAD(P)-dependent dehydrogenase (short-subunit alcohol dehydrogenase family)